MLDKHLFGNESLFKNWTRYQEIEGLGSKCTPGMWVFTRSFLSKVLLQTVHFFLWMSFQHDSYLDNSSEQLWIMKLLSKAILPICWINTYLEMKVFSQTGQAIKKLMVWVPNVLQECVYSQDHFFQKFWSKQYISFYGWVSSMYHI